MPASESPGGRAEGVLRSALDEELNWLPHKDRVALVLCYLEGKTPEEAARQMGWPAGSMAWRLAHARRRLHRRLARRGLMVPAGLLGLWLSQQGSYATPLPAGLAESTARAAVGFTAGETAAPAGFFTAPEEALQRLFGRRGPWLTLLLLAVLLAALLVAALASGAGTGKLAGGASAAPARHGGR